MERNEKFEEGKVYPYHKCRHSKGGFKMNYVEDNSVKAVVVSVMKQLGTKILKGEIGNIMAVSRPVAMCKNIGFLECIANDHVQTDFLKEAASSDPLRQMQLICAHSVTGVYHNSELLFTKAPIEPSLGETIQLTKSDGTKFYAEQTSQNPPTADVLIIGPNQCYRQYNTHQVKVNINAGFNSLVGKAVGKQTFEFADNKITSNLIEMYIDGLVMGDRVLHYKGKIEVENKKHNLFAQISFNYTSEGSIAKISNTISSLFGGGKKKSETVVEKDSFDISIYKISPNASDSEDDDIKACISKGSGNWLSYLQFDGKILWKITDPLESWSSDSSVLNSDSTQRLDRQLIGKEQIDLAQKEKLRFETEMARQQKLRDSSKKK